MHIKSKIVFFKTKREKWITHHIRNLVISNSTVDTRIAWLLENVIFFFINARRDVEDGMILGRSIFVYIVKDTS